MRLLIGGICGTDLHISQNHHHSVRLPYEPGHEIIGVVEAAAPDVEIAIGTRIAVDPMAPCGRCQYCQEQRTNLCTETLFFGCNTPAGGFSDFFRIWASQAVPLPAELTDLEAVLVEPLSTPMHAARLAGDLAGKTVAILGAGTIGLLMLITARRLGAEAIAVSNTSPAKLATALDLGADSVHDAATPNMVKEMRAALGRSADVVFDCVAIQSTMNQAVALAGKGGTIVIVGIPLDDISLPLPTVQDHEIQIQGSATYTRADIESAIAMIGGGYIPAEKLVTARFPLTDIADAFKAAGSREHIKVVVDADYASQIEHSSSPTPD